MRQVKREELRTRRSSPRSSEPELWTSQQFQNSSSRNHRLSIRASTHEPFYGTSHGFTCVLNVGDQVEALYNNETHWYEGTISEVHRDGSFSIEYEDGDVREDVPRDEIHLHSPDLAERPPVPLVSMLPRHVTCLATTPCHARCHHLVTTRNLAATAPLSLCP